MKKLFGVGNKSFRKFLEAKSTGTKVERQGSSLTIINVPSSLIVLNASRSMKDVVDNAVTSAFINLLSVERVRGKTASVTFSANYYSVGWQGLTLEGDSLSTLLRKHDYASSERNYVARR
ncbi:MAG: hypothetical protein ACUVQ0_01630 [Thermoproteota archaeon]